MTYKIYINHILWIFKIRKILPKDIIQNKSVYECSEPMINIFNTPKFLFSTKTKQFYLRKTLVKKLKQVSQSLPQGIHLKLNEGYRSLEKQKQIWDKEFEKIKKKNPKIRKSEIERLTRLCVAYPIKNACGHQTGGAIDLTLCRKNGRTLNMGTEILEFNKKTKTQNFHLTREERNNRKILKQTMEKYDFINFPGEWWHYCYGDKIWAAYKKKKYAIYNSTTIK